MKLSEYFELKLNAALETERCAHFDEFALDSYCGLRAIEIIDQASLFMRVCRDDHSSIVDNIRKAAQAAIEVCLFG